MRLADLSLKEILDLSPYDYSDKILTPEEINHLFVVCDALWMYDYEAAKNGKVGYHALLKSGLHSNGFLSAPKVLEHPSLRKILAYSLANTYDQLYPIPDRVVGIPNAATELGNDIADIWDIKKGGLVKDENGKMVVNGIRNGESLLLVEDICTKATGYIEAYSLIKEKLPSCFIVPIELVIWNRGILERIESPFWDEIIRIKSLVSKRISEMDPNNCLLCKTGSIAIKPKATEENWALIKNAQK